MELNDPILWNGLTMIATKTKNEPIMRAYKSLFLYFRNGIPHDKTFDYYQLISKITLDLKQWKETENQKLLKTCSQRTSKEKVKAINDKLLPLRERTSAEMESRFLRDKVHLFLNYSEEFNQFRRIGNTGGFQLSPRATRSQISQIGQFVNHFTYFASKQGMDSETYIICDTQHSFSAKFFLRKMECN
jgi:hypothetical protein